MFLVCFVGKGKCKKVEKLSTKDEESADVIISIEKGIAIKNRYGVCPGN